MCYIPSAFLLCRFISSSFSLSDKLMCFMFCLCKNELFGLSQACKKNRTKREAKKEERFFSTSFLSNFKYLEIFFQRNRLDKICFHKVYIHALKCFQCFEIRHPESSAVKRTFFKIFAIVMTQNNYGDVTGTAANSLDDNLSLYTVSPSVLNNFEKNSK